MEGIRGAEERDLRALKCRGKMHGSGVATHDQRGVAEQRGEGAEVGRRLHCRLSIADCRLDRGSMSALGQIAHRFEAFLVTLLREVQKRSILQGADPGDEDLKELLGA